MPRRVVIIGGGFSGLACGVALSERGHNVLLLERRNHLGGRAYSFTDLKTGDTVDNGQHLFMGCYKHTIAFLDKIDCLSKLKFQKQTRIDFLDTTGAHTSLKCASLPAPFHFLGGLLMMEGITLGDKLRSLRLGGAIRSNGATGAGKTNLTVAEWLDSLNQSETMRQRFWYPIAIATLNERPEIASAQMMKRALQEAFNGPPANSSLGIARVGLSQLYTDGARDYIESRGGQVRRGATAERLLIENNRVAAVEMKDNEIIRADYFIVAVTPGALFQMLPAELKRGEFAYLTSLSSSPILSINLWFDRQVIDYEFAGLLGTRVQWVFNKDLILSSAKKSNHVAMIISAARDYIDWSKEELVEMALEELHEVLPASRAAKLLHSVIVKEREATISHTVNSDSLRPGPLTSISNLVLAGDWTDTGLPATIESAVISGHAAADCVD